MIDFSKLYTLVEGNYPSIHGIVMINVEKLITSRTWRDPSRLGREDTFGGVVLFEVLTALFSEYVPNFYKGGSLLMLSYADISSSSNLLFVITLRFWISWNP